jgi:hypothetical protein
MTLGLQEVKATRLDSRTAKGKGNVHSRRGHKEPEGEIDV